MQTISGGATKTSAGVWVNSEGVPLSKEQIKAAEAVHEAHAADLDAQEQALQERLANSRNVIVVRESAPKAAKEK